MCFAKNAGHIQIWHATAKNNKVRDPLARGELFKFRSIRSVTDNLQDERHCCPLMYDARSLYRGTDALAPYQLAEVEKPDRLAGCYAPRNLPATGSSDVRNHKGTYHHARAVNSKLLDDVVRSVVVVGKKCIARFRKQAPEYGARSTQKA